MGVKYGHAFCAHQKYFFSLYTWPGRYSLDLTFFLIVKFLRIRYKRAVSNIAF